MSRGAGRTESPPPAHLPLASLLLASMANYFVLQSYGEPYQVTHITVKYFLLQSNWSAKRTGRTQPRSSSSPGAPFVVGGLAYFPPTAVCAKFAHTAFSASSPS